MHFKESGITLDSRAIATFERFGALDAVLDPKVRV
jgi:hypothetical protein